MKDFFALPEFCSLRTGTLATQAKLYLMFLLITQHEVPFINTREATKMLSARTENGNFQRSQTVEVVKASQPAFTLSLLTSLKASEHQEFLEDTGLEDKCSWVLFAAGEIA